jgi:hypothetical protein
MVESSGGVFAPKEQQNLAQGFNPGLTIPKTAALKVAADQGAFTNTVGNLLGRSYRIWCPREALRPRPRRRPRPRFLAGGVLEYWSIGVLRLLRIAPAQRAGDAFRAHPEKMHNPGLKPWAMIYCPFGAFP